MLVFMFRKQLVNAPEDRTRISKLDENSYLKDKVLLRKSLFVLGAVMIAATFALLAYSVYLLGELKPKAEPQTKAKSKKKRSK